MSFRPFLIGTFLLTLSPTVFAQSSSAGNYQLYERIHVSTNQELLLEGINDSVVSYVTHLMDQEKMIPEGKTVEDMQEVVKAAFETRFDDFCEMYNAIFDNCSLQYQTIRDWAIDILDMQGLTQDLLYITSGYETGVTGSLGEVFTISERLLNIRHIWGSKDDAILTPEVFPPVRAMPRPEGMSDGMFEELGQELQSAGSNALWRYRYGITPITDEGDCQEESGDAELYNVTTQRWCNVEEKLTALRDILPANALDFTPPLQRGEVVIFPLRKLETPPHVVVWMMAEQVGNDVRREVGVGWDLALDPVYPGILRENTSQPCDRSTLSDSYCTVAENFSILPGGLYAAAPTEPPANEGVCNLPFGRDGYLCRPMRHDRCTAEIADRDPRSIVLTECKPTQAKQPMGLTESGPDICRTGWWRSPTEELLTTPPGDAEDGQFPPQGCGLCRVSFSCEETCPGGFVAFTSAKDDRGVVHVCLARSAQRSLLRTEVIHELVHVQQMCGLAPHANLFDTAEHCCAREMEANTVSCRILAEDGILNEMGVSLEECTGGIANLSCTSYGQNACSAVDDQEMNEKLIEALNRRDQEQGANQLSCDDLAADWTAGLARLDTRILSMIESLNGACSPGCKTKYENTIGNNFCYVGQCIEQSIEQNRVIPGRMATEVQDESFPWDACAAEDQRFGGLVILPAISPPSPPPYNPRLLVESLDRALCQINGLPSLTPPILCQFDPQRRLSNPAESNITTALSTVGQNAENIDPVESLQAMTQSIATRIGTDLLAEYLRWAGGALSDTMRAGNQLLRNMERVELPDTTCPRNAVEPPDFCTGGSSSSSL